MNNQNELLEKKELRDRMAGRVDVLNRVKGLLLLPNTEYATVEQVAEYYEVGKEAISSLVHDNRIEVESDGYEVYKGKEIANSHVISFKSYNQNRANYKFILNDDTELSVGGKGIGLFPRRAILHIAFYLSESEVARQVRKELLKENSKLYYELSKANQTRFKKYETEIKNYLEFSFGKDNVKYQVPCGKYILDFVLFDTFHVEVDEHGHGDYNKSNERKRGEYIENNTNYLTIGYNPQTQLPYEIIKDILEKM